MTTTVRWQRDRVAVVEVAGDLDVQSAPHLRAVLDEVCRLQPVRIEVDLGGITFFSCAGVRELLDTRRHCAADLAIVRPAPAVRRVMDTLGLGWDLQAVSV